MFNRTVVSYTSVKQKTIATAILEAEYIALSKVV